MTANGAISLATLAISCVVLIVGNTYNRYRLQKLIDTALGVWVAEHTDDDRT